MATHAPLPPHAIHGQVILRTLFVPLRLRGGLSGFGTAVTASAGLAPAISVVGRVLASRAWLFAGTNIPLGIGRVTQRFGIDMLAS
jgi:hypothetical protein